MGKPSPLGSCFLGRVLRRRAAGEVGIPAATTRARPRAPGSRSIAAMRNCRHNRAPWPRPRPRRSWRATLSFACVRVAGAALLLLPAAAAYAPGGAAEPHGRRHGRDADASNQTTPPGARRSSRWYVYLVGSCSLSTPRLAPRSCAGVAAGACALWRGQYNVGGAVAAHICEFICVGVVSSLGGS